MVARCSAQDALAKGILFVVLGASSYGMLSTFVKLAYKQGFTTAEITTAQFGWGVLALTIMGLWGAKDALKPTQADKRNLVFAGIPIGLTGILYYASVQYIDASIAVVLLMQSVWMGVLAESAYARRWPEFGKIASIALILAGTLLATDLWGNTQTKPDMRGIVLGMLAALAFSCTFFTTSRVATHIPPVKRGQFMLYGGASVVGIFCALSQIGPYYFNIHLLAEGFIQDKAFDMDIFLSYGLIVAIFGTVIPPIMLNKGFPIVGVGLGSILSSIELPFAIIIAFTFLGETVSITQWLGVFIIIAAIVLLNYKLVTQSKRRPM